MNGTGKQCFDIVCCSRITVLSWTLGKFPLHILFRVVGSNNVAVVYSSEGISVHAQLVYIFASRAVLDHGPLEGIRECYNMVGNGERSYLLESSVDMDILGYQVEFRVDADRGGGSQTQRSDSVDTRYESHWDFGPVRNLQSQLPAL